SGGGRAAPGAPAGLRPGAAAGLGTVHGPGGVGKPRPAREAARRHLRESPREAWFAQLATVGSREALFAAIAGALGLSPAGPRPVEAQVADHLRGRRGLLLLDAFEGVAAEAAALTDLLAAA